jgi:glycogen synthase
MRHLILSREYPPALYPPGGIGTYVLHISRLLAESGEEVHVIAQRWDEAPAAIEELCGGRLVVHRVAGEDPPGTPAEAAAAAEELRGLLASPFPERWFSWRAARLAEQLVENEGIDVIEAQDWEAPLYDFQLRRALGRGPRRMPPCIVHLHSPTEFIFLHNGWDLGRPDYLPMKRLEDYSIAAADALIAPSRFLARQCEARYGLGADSITVLPHPVGDNPVIERPEATWSKGTICFVGRLEPRKGVLEWVQAAVPVAADHQEARFDFVGADAPYGRATTVKEHVERQIPDQLRDRFTFRGSHDRAGVRRFLAGAWAAVVPSRWENLPYTCIEAMASGLPVIASRRGGMADMVENGRTGWLAPEGAGETLVEGLQDALRRALATTPARRAAMGRDAAAAIRRLGDNASVIRKHIDFRERVARQEERVSIQVPSIPSFAPRPAACTIPRRSATQPMKGLAVVVVGIEPDEALRQCIESVLCQTLAPCAVAVVVGPDGASAVVQAAVERVKKAGWLVVEERGRSAAAARNAGMQAVQNAVGPPGGWVFVDAWCRLRPEWLEVCHHTLRHCLEVGLVSSWQRGSGTGSIAISPCPALPYQWLVNDAVACSAFRDEALRESGGFRRSLDAAYHGWDLVNAVLAAGWAAVTYPAVLSEVDEPAGVVTTGPERLRMHRALLERFPDLVARDASELLLLQSCRSGVERVERDAAPRLTKKPTMAPGPRELLRRPLAEQITFFATAFRHPRRASSWLRWHLRRKLLESLEPPRHATTDRDP